MFRLPVPGGSDSFWYGESVRTYLFIWLKVQPRTRVKINSYSPTLTGIYKRCIYGKQMERLSVCLSLDSEFGCFLTKDKQKTLRQYVRAGGLASTDVVTNVRHFWQKQTLRGSSRVFFCGSAPVSAASAPGGGASHAQKKRRELLFICFKVRPRTSVKINSTPRRPSIYCRVYKASKERHNLFTLLRRNWSFLKQG